MRFLISLPHALVLALALALPLPLSATDLVYDAFESDGFGEWALEGKAFGKSPTAASPRGLNGKVTAYSGSYYVSSAHGGDRPTGSLTSPEIELKLPYLGFHISGGKHKGKTAVQLLIDNKVVLEANGQNSLVMRQVIWPLKDHLGKKARLRIIDNESGTWGIINADHFVFSDQPQPFFPKTINPTARPNSARVATDVIPGMTVPNGSVVTLFANNKDHKIYSPTAITVDDQGKVYIAETHRLRSGVEDNRDHLYWIVDDMASQSTDDRLAMYEKWKGRFPPERLTKVSDKVRILVDSDGDGVADTSQIFADQFNKPLDGVAAGVMAFEGKIYFACIPNIMTLEDTDGDLKADVQNIIQDGFGVRVSFSGHDLNGFVLGPDGRLYATIGDRGFSITTREGKLYHFPGQGAILRFDPDGSHMEVVHTGLRNPKEIAFDKFGTAITVDNNSDQGDRARVVFMLEGADSGWRMGHQILHSFHTTAGIPDRPINQWMQEKMWEPQNEAQPGHIIPPMLNLTSGPSGLAYYPGTGFSLGCRDQFLICDYRGSAAVSGIWNFSIKEKGAGFAVDQARKFNWGVAATDLEWGPDGKLYVADYVSGWSSHNNGRIYSLAEKNPGESISQLLAETNLKEAPSATLASLLSHPDQRIRLRAQLYLADRPDALGHFTAASNQTLNPIERLHGIWGLGIMARKHQSQAATAFLVKQLQNNVPLVRAQIAQALGESTLKNADFLTPLLSDGAPRVRALAAIAIGRIRDPKALPAILEMIQLNERTSPGDPTLRHSGVMALLGSASEPELSKMARHDSHAIRHSALLALRRLGSPECANFLGDRNLLIANDAIRAIHDTQIEAARPVMTPLLDDPALGSSQRPISRMLLRRLIHSAFRIGNKQNLTRLIKAAAHPTFPIEERQEAMRLLAMWVEPHAVDQSIGKHAPLPSRDPQILKTVLTKNIGLLLAGGPEIFGNTMKLALKNNIEHEGLDSGSLTRIIRDDQTDAQTRAAALNLFLKGNPEDADLLLSEAAASKNDTLANAALTLASKRNPAATVAALRGALASENSARRQTAWRIIANLPAEHAVPLLRDGLNQLSEGKGDRASNLDLLTAAQSREEPAIKSALTNYQASLDQDDPLAKWQNTLAGGNAKRGFKIYKSHGAAQCMRCHRADSGHSEGGEAGPNLMGVALRHDARGLLESLILPHAQIADGFGIANLKFQDGSSKAGLIISQNEQHLDLKEGESQIWRIKRSDLAEEPKPLSGMPAMGAILTPTETRDLLAWLLTLTKANPETPPNYKVEELTFDKAKKMDEVQKTTETPAPQPTEPKKNVSETKKIDPAIDPAVMALGKQQYMLCAACHGQQGEGVANVGPPLANSEWVTGPIENLIRIQLRGLKGPIKVNGKDYDFPAGMVAMGMGQPDENIAAVLTYIRNDFGNTGTPVTPAMVAALKGEIGKPQLTVADLIDPHASAATSEPDAPAPVLAQIPSTGLGAPTIGLVMFLIIAGLSLLGALRMKATSK